MMYGIREVGVKIPFSSVSKSKRIVSLSRWATQN